MNLLKSLRLKVVKGIAIGSASKVIFVKMDGANITTITDYAVDIVNLYSSTS